MIHILISLLLSLNIISTEEANTLNIEELTTIIESQSPEIQGNWDPNEKE